MLNAIQSGIVTASTKGRLEELEVQKESLKLSILKEEAERPVISKEIFKGWIEHFREYDTTDTDQRQRLVDHFMNSIYLYDDHFDLFLNFKEDAETISFSQADILP